MAKQDFLENVRTARNLFLHPPVEAASPELDSPALAQKLARAAIWLTPRSVRGLNASDFPDLGVDRQRELETAVKAFLEVANQVPTNRPPTPEQYQNAMAAFKKLLDILSPYLATPEEGKMVENTMRSIELPSWVVNWDYELGSDAEGSPAVWINLFADENAASPRDFGQLASRLTQRLWQPLSVAGVNRWPYIRVRTALEHKSM